LQIANHEDESPVRNLDLDSLRLQAGYHPPSATAFNMMEAVAYIAGEEWNDHPLCVSQTISAFCRHLNDDLNDVDRQQLLAYIPRVIGTQGNRDIWIRQEWMITDWMVRTYLSAWWDLAGYPEHANGLRRLHEINSPGAFNVAKAKIVTSEKNDFEWREAVMAREVSATDITGKNDVDHQVWDAALEATKSAAKMAARCAATPAALPSGWNAAWWASRADPIWIELGYGMRSDQTSACGPAVIGHAALKGAWKSIWKVALQAATTTLQNASTAHRSETVVNNPYAGNTSIRHNARNSAGEVSWEAAEKSIQPTVQLLQTSAFDLLDRLIACSR
jgi:hypothetical protein